MKLFKKRIKKKELWDLDVYIARYALPRLREFRKRSWRKFNELTEEETDETLDKIIWSLSEVANGYPSEMAIFDKYASDESSKDCEGLTLKKITDKDNYWKENEANYNRTQEGLQLFGKYFTNLNW